MKVKISGILVVSFCLMASLTQALAEEQAKPKTPLRVAIAGLVHGHVGWVFDSHKRGDIQIVGIAEPDARLAAQYLKRYNLPESLLFSDLDQLLTKIKPEAVTAFNSIFNHLEVVKACAPKGVHVMVEKPLAVNLDHARQIEQLARKHNIQVLTNYETTWYGSNHKAFELIHNDKAIGSIRKIVVHDGHQGPKEIGVGPEFLAWLTDPVQNGGGALIDFGCYGANLITWLMQGQRPVSVTAITQQLKPDIYPKVEDEATIIVTYPKAQGIIQGSWNWPYSRKDMEVYGETGSIITVDNTRMRLRLKATEPEQMYEAPTRPAPYHDPFLYLTAVVNGQVKPGNTLSSLAVNMIVMEILDAARQSAKEGKTIYLTPTIKN